MTAPRFVIVFDNDQTEPAERASIHATLERAKARNLGAELREGDRVLIVARRVASEASGWLAYYTLEGQTAT
jgi:hypothetical protein